MRKRVILLTLLLSGGLTASAWAALPTVDASSTYATKYPAAAAVDGDEFTRWASASTDRAQWTLDFGQVVPIDALAVRWERACAGEYRIESSRDGKTWTTLAHEREGREGTAHFTDLGGEGRWLRIDCLRASDRYKHVSIWEVTFDDPQLRKLVKSLPKPEFQPKEPPPLSLAEAKTALARHGVREIIFATRADSNDGHWYANLGYWSYDENSMLYGKGGRLCKLDVQSGALTILIDDPEGTVRDPVVHYDARKILFSWRKGESRVFHLYECDLQGRNITQITDGQYDDIEPCYLPDGGIIFVSGRGKRYVNCWLTQVAILYRCDADGRNIRQLSANIEQDNTPWVLPDGRVLYQRWEYIDRNQVSYHHLWTMNPDGTNQMVYYGNQQPRGLYIDAKPIPGTDDVLFVNSPAHGRREHSGQVAVVNADRGPDDATSLRNVTKAEDYRDPWPLSDDLFLAARGRKIVVLNARGGEATLFTLPDAFEAEVNLQEPRPVIPRARERVRVLQTDPAQSTGRLILQDVRTGRNMTGVAQGEIKKLLVLESLPKPINFTGGMDPLTYGGSFTLERIVGTVPVEADGSAYLELPAKRSFFFVAMDEHDNSIKRMQSFLTVMPGEVQSCVGCHEPRATAPKNQAVQGDLLALRRRASVPESVADVPDVIDFPRDIQPILDRHCVECHDQRSREGGVVLSGDRGPMFSHSYVTLTIRGQFIDGRNLAVSNYAPRTIGATASPLMRKLDGQHYDARVSPREKKLVRYWIETGATYPGTYAALGHGAIGGYQQNKLVNLDTELPTHPTFAQVVKNRCTECHLRELDLPTPTSMSDEIGISFWKFEITDPRMKFSRHLMFNLTDPEESQFLLGPLSVEAGGLGLCRGEVFADTTDPGYQALLAHIVAGKEYLDNELTRFDMPHFRPRREYFRELVKYGILPPKFDPASDPFDVYQLDRQYWKSLWYRPD